MNTPAALIIMDGHGIAAPGPTNAISEARTPCLDELYRSCPHCTIQASGAFVGLPDGQMGNSEVGHLNIGAGRVVYQELTRISRACEDGSLRQNEVLLDAFRFVKNSGGALHIMGLLSDGGVHSSNEHLYAIMRFAHDEGISDMRIHCFLDGRDVPPTSALGYIDELSQHIDELNSPSCAVRIASLAGRYWAMDRDNRWERVERAYTNLAFANPIAHLSPAEYVESSYAAGISDEFVEPVSFMDGGINNNDALVFFNFRPDRAREITHCFTDAEPFIDHAIAGVRPYFVCLTEYDPTIPAKVAFAKSFPEMVLADVLAQAQLRQYHIAETEKYAHVTFFLNGGKEEEKAGEKRVLIPSPKVATYDLQPEMSAPEVAATLAGAIRNNEADVYIVNFANCDMVGHTGVLSAAIKAVEAVDAGIAEVLDALQELGGVALITADHGNADVMCAEDGSPHTAHTTNPVPLILVDYANTNRRLRKDAQGALCNLSPTLLDLIGIDKPAEMDAESLLA